MAGIIDTHDNDRQHYHVVAFINGCLNDYDSGPIDTFEDAVTALRDYMNEGGMQPDTEVSDVFGETRYQQGLYTIQVEACQEEACSAVDHMAIYD